MIRWAGVTLVADWLMVTQAKKHCDITVRTKSDQLIFRQVFIEMDQDKKRGGLCSRDFQSLLTQRGPC